MLATLTALTLLVTPVSVGAGVTQTGLTPTWNAPTDAVGVAGYDVFPDGTKRTNVTTTSSSQIGLARGTSYSFAVVARDATANSSTDRSLQVATSPPSAPPPSPGNRYTNVSFAGSKYDGQGLSAIFEAYQSDSRLSSWGGTDPPLYDQWGMSTDTSQRVHLKQVGGRLGSWQELRTTDGPWTASAPTLAKSSLNVSQAATWGPGGFGWGIERWFAFDILFPLDVNGVSFEFAKSWNTLGDLHSNGGDADPALTRIYPNRNSHPKFLTFSVTPNWRVHPYRNANLVQLTDARGSRVTSNFNVWHEVVIGMKTAYDGSRGNSSGWVEVWVDGEQKLARTSTPQFDPSEAGPYFQLQNYTQYPTSYFSGATRSAIAYGGFRAGLTRADVQTR